MYNEGRIGDRAGDRYEPDPQFRTILDETGAIQISAPVEWSDVAGRPTTIGPSLTVSPNNDAFERSFNASGVFVLVSDQFRTTPEAVLMEMASPICTMVHVTTYANASGLAGPLHLATACGGSLTSEIDWVAETPTGAFVVVKIRVVTEQDRRAADAILESIRVSG